MRPWVRTESAQTFTYPVSGGSAPSQPRTGDSTPLVLLGTLLVLSLCGMFISRRRSA